MGNSFGHIPSNTYKRIMHPETMPEPYSKSKFDPQLGFDGGRKERVMIATEEEMISAKLTLKERDYCAHVLLKYRGCRREHWPFAVKCHHEKEEYLHCQYEDFIMRMKEYERERRLQVRQLKQDDGH